MKANNESIKIAKLINTFLNNNVTAGRTRSDHTLRAYNDTLSLYLNFLETAKGISSETLCGECFSVENIEAWMTWLEESRSCCPATCNIRLASLRAFLKYLGKCDVSYLHLSQSASQIVRRKVLVNKIKGISKSGIQALLAAPDIKTRMGRRDTTLMVVMYSTAARIDEILSMKVEHLQLDTLKPCVTVVGKGFKIRTLYLTPKVVAHLKSYLNEFHGVSPNPSAYVFYSRNSGLFGKLSQNTVNFQLRKHAVKARESCLDVPINIHAHQIRHAKASHWLEDGMNILQISFLLGHSNIQTTMVYLDITAEQLGKSLATIEDENTKNLPKNWKTVDKNLSSFCGARQVKPKLNQK
jgi:site-specific recombinase XerD